jgi:riboflavin kinase/FMN adenylyltransferase
MKIYRSLAEVPADFGPSALTIGNFDGVHFGHRRILRRLKSLADARGWKPSVLTFDPHPTRVVAPKRTPRLLTSIEGRTGLMREEGVEQVLILPFTRELAVLTSEEFARQLLVGRLNARAVLVGENFRFGHRHGGNVRVLGELGRRLGFETEIVPSATCRGRVVSSSGIRELIRSGRVSLAARFLLHPYALEGRIVTGRGIGSKQTVPTLNLATAAEVIPARGVYVTRTRHLETGRQWDSLTNIGYRPTFGASDQLSIETFLLGGVPPGPGVAVSGRLRVEFLWRVRDERTFDSPQALKEQILKDTRTAQRYLRRAKAWIGRPGRPCL